MNKFVNKKNQSPVYCALAFYSQFTIFMVMKRLTARFSKTNKTFCQVCSMK